MGYHKGHKEFHALDMEKGWHTPPGYPAGIQQKIIAGELDEKARRGNRTRFLRFAPGVYTTSAVRARILGGSVPAVRAI